MSEINEANLHADVNGAAAGRVIRTAPIQSGARLSKNFKLLGVILVAFVCTAIAIGVLTSGNQANKTETDGQVAMAGLTQPDTNAMQKKALDGQAKPPLSNGESPPAGLSSQAANGTLGTTGGAATALTPQQAHQRWLEEQYFKSLEKNISNGQAAKESIITVGGLGRMGQLGQSALSGTSNPIADNPQIAALRKRLESSGQAGSDIDRLVAAASAAGLGGTPSGPATNINNQAVNNDFLTKQELKKDSGYLYETLNQPLGKHQLFAGSVIPAVTVTGVNSELPGDVSAMVRQTVYDSRNPRVVLIPQGTRIVGLYNAGVQYGQQRIMVAWNRLIYPDGRSIDIKGMQGTDGIGQDGLNDQVDNHYMRTFGSALLISLLGVEAQLSQPQNSSLLTAPSASAQAAGAAASQLNTVGTNLLNKNMNIAPTLSIRPGFAFNVMVNKTMILPAYE
ncbi:MAG: hypothetical protein RLY95_5 [Pseudomonadota bacterium]|jgi:type IV secretion system protein TrbI